MKTIVDVLEFLVKSSAHVDLTNLDYKANTKCGVSEGWDPVFKSLTTTVPMNKLVFSTTRPNISINTDLKGSIAVPDDVANEYGLPSTIETQVYRNYSVVRNGEVRMKQLPVIIATDKLMDLQEMASFEVYRTVGVMSYVKVNLDQPLINRTLVEVIDPVDFKILAYKTLKSLQLKAIQKVFNYYLKEEKPASIYSKEATELLLSKGITANSFSSKSTHYAGEYECKEMHVKVKGMSSLPTIDSVLKKVEAGKNLTVSDKAINEGLDIYCKAVVNNEDMHEFKRQLKQAIRDVDMEISKIMHNVIMLDICTPKPFDAQYDETDFKVTIVVEEKTVKL